MGHFVFDILLEVLIALTIWPGRILLILFRRGGLPIRTYHAVLVSLGLWFVVVAAVMITLRLAG